MSFKAKLLLLVSQIATIVALISINNSLEVIYKPRRQIAKTQRGVTFADLIARNPQVLGAVVTPSPAPTPKPQPLSKSTYTIAVIGDSMVETMGGSLDYLKAALKSKYPKENFVMYNYGLGSENVMEGLKRFDRRFSYSDRIYPPISDINADVIIVGSYAYNPPFPYDRTLHFSSLADLVTKAKGVSKKVFVLGEIAPLEDGFGNGPGGVNWPQSITKPHVLKILELLANAKGVAASLGVGFIDVYSKTRSPNSLYGSYRFVDPNDNIHPSKYGQTFTAEEIARTIRLP